MTKVEFYLDGALQSTDTTSPYAWSWDTTTATNGSHSLSSKAYDAALQHRDVDDGQRHRQQRRAGEHRRLDADAGQLHADLHDPGRHDDPVEGLRDHRAATPRRRRSRRSGA